MFDMNWLEIFGYVASIITGISLTMNSIVRLRWLNLLGASCFGTYGVLIGATPVAALNYFIACANIYYLWKMYNEKAHFSYLDIDLDDKYLDAFLKFNNTDVKALFPSFDIEKASQKETISMMIHRDLALAGVFIGSRSGKDTLDVELDFVLPQYRDLKAGQYIFKENADFFTKQGIKLVTCKSGSVGHDRYLENMGFARDGNDYSLKLA
ncbi:YgjV family protein [Pelagibaculum spongiae]|uniref:N-acetyltransferase domain-containing protein n=1 Tax=Pelagibaculum spongiae TaxID=2080658 RepID=A0A2V1GSL4_9GAMM|nr:YgjV family protein [Pelagibaculum spongiae]PVZ64381.1 hypothetical protein DC094_20200 [Pelagibaculum spongiae]